MLEPHLPHSLKRTVRAGDRLLGNINKSRALKRQLDRVNQQVERDAPRANRESQR